MASKAIPYLEEEGQWWIEKKECVSCHHTSFGIWAGTLARATGLDFSETLLGEWNVWAWESLLSQREKKKPDEPDEQVGERNIEGLGQLLVSGAKPPSAAAEEKFRDLIAKHQKADGFWSPNGQLPSQLRDQEETTAVSTMWAALALALADKPDQRVTEKAEAWLRKDKKTNSAETTEWFAMRALLDCTDESFADLLERQNDDGGWSWANGEASDPMSTGQALTVIGRFGKIDEYESEVGKAVGYLKAAQDSEGHWKTFSTKDRAEQTRISNFWGTAWAVIGLLEAEQTKAVPAL